MFLTRCRVAWHSSDTVRQLRPPGTAAAGAFVPVSTRGKGPGSVEDGVEFLENRENHVIGALLYAIEGRQRGSYDGSLSWVG